MHLKKPNFGRRAGKLQLHPAADAQHGGAKSEKRFLILDECRVTYKLYLDRFFEMF